MIQILQNYKADICLQVNCKNNLKSKSIFVDLKKKKQDFATIKNVAEPGFKHCPPAPCLAPPVPHEGQQGLLLHLHLNLLDLVLDLYLVLRLLILVVKLVL